MDTLWTFNDEGRLVVYRAFEVHFSATGDRNIPYRDLVGEILCPNDLVDLHRQRREFRNHRIEPIARPHHVGYRQGRRGIDWVTFDTEFSPIVELISMHGCSGESDTARPFLHVMGTLDEPRWSFADDVPCLPVSLLSWFPSKFPYREPGRPPSCSTEYSHCAES